MWRWGSQPHGTEPTSRRRAPVCRKLNTVRAATIERRWLQLRAGSCTHRADDNSKRLAADDALVGEEPAKLLLPHESMRPN
jgi:hypothetical protein